MKTFLKSERIRILAMGAAIAAASFLGPVLGDWWIKFVG